MRNYRLGVIVRADETGLGFQTLSYYKYLKPDKTILVDLSPLNGNKQHYDWYNYNMLIKGIPTLKEVNQILDNIDVLLTAETPYNLDLYEIARGRGIKTICVENAEFYDHIKYPQYQLPDLIIMPSVWLLDMIKEHAESKGTKVVQLHHPVDRDIYRYRHRTTNKVLHSSGKPAANDRNGTWDFLKAYPSGGVITTQDENFAKHIRGRYRQCNVFVNLPPQQLYEVGDIMVLPRRYGGNCLPLNEALSCGLPVIMTDISPNNNLLPKEWLVSATITGYFEPRFKVDIYSSDINALAERIEWVKANIETQSEIANQIADSISWDTLLPKYEKAIESIL